jgi:hypothetical protein
MKIKSGTRADLFETCPICVFRMHSVSAGLPDDHPSVKTFVAGFNHEFPIFPEVGILLDEYGVLDSRDLLQQIWNLGKVK